MTLFRLLLSVFGAFSGVFGRFSELLGRFWASKIAHLVSKNIVFAVLFVIFRATKKFIQERINTV